ncbi:MAG: dethiobiotin synthase [Planctomycetes bacterium]|nr:dethiobiotin synthase [Planctomycetota bacterium]
MSASRKIFFNPAAAKASFDFDISGYPPLPALKGLFITGTDTEVGKTLVAGAVARSLRRGGLKVEVFKPAATGCKKQRGELVSQDAEFLAACADSRRMLSEIVPARYRAALAPNVAAARESRPIDLELIFREYSRLAGPVAAGDPSSTPDVVVVEGVGGLLCPISDDFWVIHFARMARLPVVIVARPGLGTINHTLLTIHAARSAGLEVAGVVINRYQVEPAAARSADPTPYIRGDADMSAFTNPAQIAERGRVKVLAIVPDDAKSSIEKGRIGPDAQYAIDQVDWPAIAGVET